MADRMDNKVSEIGKLLEGDISVKDLSEIEKIISGKHKELMRDDEAESIDKNITEQLSKLAQGVLKNEKDLSNTYRFADTAEAVNDFVRMKDELKNKLVCIKNKYNITITIERNIEELTCVIKIYNDNGACITFDTVDYQRAYSNFKIGERNFIEDKLITLFGRRKRENDVIVNDICDFLNLALLYDEAIACTYSSLGWENINGRCCFKYNEIWGFDNEVMGYCVSDFASRLICDECLMENGITGEYHYRSEKVESYRKKLSEYFYNNSIASILLSATLSGFVRKFVYERDNNININICGGAGTGKTTIERLVMSFICDPEQFEGSFRDSENTIAEARKLWNVIPYVIDDRLFKYEEFGDAKKAREIMLDIFNEYNNKSKTNQFDIKRGRIQKNYYNPVISSTVESIMDLLLQQKSRDLGQYRRLIEVRVDKDTFFNGVREANAFNEVIEKYYGFFAKDFVTGIYRFVKKFAFIYKKNMQDDEEEKQDKKTVDFVAKSVEKNKDELCLEDVQVFMSAVNRFYIDKDELGRVNEESSLLNEKEIERVFKSITEICKSIIENRINNEKEEIRSSLIKMLGRFSLLCITALFINIAEEDAETKDDLEYIDVDKMLEKLINQQAITFEKIVNNEVAEIDSKEEKKRHDEMFVEIVKKVFSWIKENKDSGLVYNYLSPSNYKFAGQVIAYKDGNIFNYNNKKVSLGWIWEKIESDEADKMVTIVKDTYSAGENPNSPLLVSEEYSWVYEEYERNVEKKKFGGLIMNGKEERNAEYNCTGRRIDKLAPWTCVYISEDN